LSGPAAQAAVQTRAMANDEIPMAVLSGDEGIGKRCPT